MIIQSEGPYVYLVHCADCRSHFLEGTPPQVTRRWRGLRSRRILDAQSTTPIEIPIPEAYVSNDTLIKTGESADVPHPLREVESWLSEEQLSFVYSSEYWNDIEEEKKKALWIEDGSYEKCLTYLRRSNLLAEFEAAADEILLQKAPVKVADLAAGIGWTSCLLSRLENVSEVHSVEISKHRIGILFERCVRMLAGNPQKIFRYVGSFYDLKFPDNSFDLVFLSQAFHHAENPFQLLQECKRICKRDGMILLMGEPYIGPMRILRRFFSELIRHRRLQTNFFELFKPEPVLGDHYYRVSDYDFLSIACGLRARHIKMPHGTVTFFITPA